MSQLFKFLVFEVFCLLFSYGIPCPVMSALLNRSGECFRRRGRYRVCMKDAPKIRRRSKIFLIRAAGFDFMIIYSLSMPGGLRF